MILLGSGPLLGIIAYYRAGYKLIDIQKLLSLRSAISIIPPYGILLSACPRTTELSVL
jgi:hypothetical protein